MQHVEQPYLLLSGNKTVANPGGLEDIGKIGSDKKQEAAELTARSCRIDRLPINCWEDKELRCSRYD